MNLEDLFTVATLTAAINKLPMLPQRAAQLGIFEEEGVTTTTVVVDQLNGRLVLVPNTSREDSPAPVPKDGRVRRTFTTTHLPLSAVVLPSEIQNIAAFGEDSVLDNQARVINNKLQSLKNSIDATREWQRVGAIKGQILDANASVIYDLYDEFGVTKQAANVALSNANTNVRKAFLDAMRSADAKLGGLVVQGFRAICGGQFFDALTDHPKVQKAYEGYQEAQDRIGGDMRKGFKFGEVVIEEYAGQVSGQSYVAATKCHIFPVIRSGAYKTVNSPANYNETVNTVGQAFYSKAEPRKMGKGWDLEAQANPLSLCLFPEALFELTAT